MFLIPHLARCLDIQPRAKSIPLGGESEIVDLPFLVVQALSIFGGDYIGVFVTSARPNGSKEKNRVRRSWVQIPRPVNIFSSETPFKGYLTAFFYNL